MDFDNFIVRVVKGMNFLSKDDMVMLVNIDNPEFKGLSETQEEIVNVLNALDDELGEFTLVNAHDTSEYDFNYNWEHREEGNFRPLWANLEELYNDGLIHCGPAWEGAMGNKIIINCNNRRVSGGSGDIWIGESRFHLHLDGMQMEVKPKNK